MWLPISAFSAYNCSKYGDKLIISDELMSDAPALIQYQAKMAIVKGRV